MRSPWTLVGRDEEVCLGRGGQCGHQGHSESWPGCFGLIWGTFWLEDSGPVGITSLAGLGCPRHVWHPSHASPPTFSLNYSSSASFVCLSGLQTRGNLVHFLEWNIEAGGRHLAFSGWTSILVRHQACLEVLTADHEQDVGDDPG